MLITEVAQKYGLSSDTLRYYERIGLLPAIARNSSGIRNYSDSDCGWVEFIKCMRDAGLPIEVLVKYVRLYNQGDSTLETRRQLLIEQRDILVKKISSMNETLEKLNFKITNYSKYSHDLHEAFKKK